MLDIEYLDSKQKANIKNNSKLKELVLNQNYVKK